MASGRAGGEEDRVFLNYAMGELNLKIVYYGAGYGGKTTNLAFIHKRLTSPARLITLNTEEDRTLMFDFMPLDVGTVAGLKLRLHLYTVPGQIHYRATRELVLAGVDGVVLVVDSQRDRLEANEVLWRDLSADLLRHGLDPVSTPRVVQYNKRDTPSAMPIADLRRRFNPNGGPEIPAIASQGVGVSKTLNTITRAVVRRLRAEGVSQR